MLSSRYFSSQPDILNAANNRPALKTRSRGEGVRRLQVALSTRGFPMPRSSLPTGGFDGIFGTETHAIVRQIQSRNGLFVDGICGRKTIAFLDRELATLEQKLRTLTVTLNPLLGNTGNRLDLTPEDLSVGQGLSEVSQVNVTSQQIMRAWKKVIVSVNEPTRMAQTMRPGATPALYTGPPGGQVQLAAAPLAIPAVALAALVALEQAILAIIALLLVVALLWALSVIIPTLVDKITQLWAAAMAEVGAAVKALNEIIATSIVAFGQCGPFLIELAKILKNIVGRSRSPIATKTIQPNAKGAKLIPNPKVLQGMKDLLLDAADILERLVACMSQNGLLSGDAYRKLLKWMTEFRELAAKLGNFKEPIGKLW